MKTLLTLLFVLSISGLSVSAKIELHSMFTDNMVLQQQADVPVWGKTSPHTEVNVTTSWDNFVYTTTSDSVGRWKVVMETPKAGGPYAITVSGGEVLRLDNILIGEVWVCGGQSNMEMTVGGQRNQINNREYELENANFPEIRLFHVEKAMSVEPLNDFKKTRGGWKVCSPETVRQFSAVAYFFGREIHQNQNVPIGLISSSLGGTLAEAWTDGKALQHIPDFAEKINIPDSLADKANMPTVLYNAMIRPMTDFSIRGVIWYQGEANCMRGYQYRELFPLLIRDWRKQWGWNFPFYFVQLPNFGDRQNEPEEAVWAEIREAQLKALNVENTGMAIIIDVGKADDVHPPNKQDVGFRLALQARANTYGEDIPYSGPIYNGYRIEGNKIRVFFDHTDSGLKVKDNSELKGFAIAGSDHVFHWADAVIEGNEVVVSSSDVEYPVSVRYAWAANPECNLYNGAGLPASPFRTDDWKRDK